MVFSNPSDQTATYQLPPLQAGFLQRKVAALHPIEPNPSKAKDVRAPSSSLNKASKADIGDGGAISNRALRNLVDFSDPKTIDPIRLVSPRELHNDAYFDTILADTRLNPWSPLLSSTSLTSTAIPSKRQKLDSAPTAATSSESLVVHLPKVQKKGHHPDRPLPSAPPVLPIINDLQTPPSTAARFPRIIPSAFEDAHGRNALNDVGDSLDSLLGDLDVTNFDWKKDQPGVSLPENSVESVVPQKPINVEKDAGNLDFGHFGPTKAPTISEPSISSESQTAAITREAPSTRTFSSDKTLVSRDNPNAPDSVGQDRVRNAKENAKPKPSGLQDTKGNQKSLSANDLSADTAKEKKVSWTDEEINYLMQGVSKHGTGKWKQIIEDPAFSFQNKSADDLKDRFKIYGASQTKANNVTLGFSSSSNDKTPNPSLKRRKWTDEETDQLLRGVAKYGIGKWKQIIQDPAFAFPNRNPSDLKDRFRTCCPSQTNSGRKSRQGMKNSQNLPSSLFFEKILHPPSTSKGNSSNAVINTSSLLPNSSPTTESPPTAMTASSPSATNPSAPAPTLDDAESPSTPTDTPQPRRRRGRKTDRRTVESLASLGINSRFATSTRRERRPFTEAEDVNLLKGFERYGSCWRNICTDASLNLSSRKPMDLRDRFRNRYAKQYEQAGYAAHANRKPKPSEGNEPSSSAPEQPKDDSLDLYDFSIDFGPECSPSPSACPSPSFPSFPFPSNSPNQPRFPTSLPSSQNSLPSTIPITPTKPTPSAAKATTSALTTKSLPRSDLPPLIPPVSTTPSGSRNPKPKPPRPAPLLPSSNLTYQPKPSSISTTQPVPLSSTLANWPETILPAATSLLDFQENTLPPFTPDFFTSGVTPYLPGSGETLGEFGNFGPMPASVSGSTSIGAVSLSAAATASGKGSGASGKPSGSTLNPDSSSSALKAGRRDMSLSMLMWGDLSFDS